MWTFSSLVLKDACLLLEFVIGKLDIDEGIDKEEVAEPHALLTILSQRFVAAMFDNDGWTVDADTLALDRILATEGAGVKVSELGRSPDNDEDDTVIEEVGILAWLLDIKKWRISANALCRPPAILNLLDVEVPLLEDILGLELKTVIDWKEYH